MALDLGIRFGADVRVPATDLSHPAAAQEPMSLTENAPVGLVAAAAVFGSIGPCLEQNVASEINMVDLNCRSTIALSHGFVQRISSERRGAIVRFCSLSGFNGAPLGGLPCLAVGVEVFAEGAQASSLSVIRVRKRKLIETFSMIVV